MNPITIDLDRHLPSPEEEAERQDLEMALLVARARQYIASGLLEGRTKERIEEMIAATEDEDWEKIAELAEEANREFPRAIERFGAAVEAERLREN